MFCDLCSSSLILRSEHEALGAKLKRGYKKSLAQQLKTTKLVLMQGDELSRLQAESVHMQEAAKTKENELRAECERLRECVKREQKEFAAVNDVQLRRITKLGRQLINQSAVLPVAETSSTTVHEELQKKTISAIPTAPKATRNVITVWEESSGSDDKHVRRTRHSAHRHPITSSTRVITPAFSPASPRELLAVQKEYAWSPPPQSGQNNSDELRATRKKSSKAHYQSPLELTDDADYFAEPSSAEGNPIHVKEVREDMRRARVRENEGRVAMRRPHPVEQRLRGSGPHGRTYEKREVAVPPTSGQAKKRSGFRALFRQRLW
jgi:hypothetical protein